MYKKYKNNELSYKERKEKMIQNRMKYVLIRRNMKSSRELFINNKRLYMKTNSNKTRNFSTMFQPPSDPDPGKWALIALLCGSLFAMFKKK